jgi:hypothetical protein
MTYSFALSKVATRVGSIAGPLIVRICLKTWTTDDDGNYCLTPDCMTEEELAAEVARLKGELDSLLRSGRKALRGGSPSVDD